MPSEPTVPGFLPEKIVSGAQTGVDRAALDVALALGLKAGGWVPKGRRAEDGPIDGYYPVQETASTDYAVRTKNNVDDSDATLILTRGEPVGGTKLTLDYARATGKPFLIVDLGRGKSPLAALKWLETNRPRVLNVAGPRESTAGGIYAEASAYLKNLLSLAK